MLLPIGSSKTVIPEDGFSVLTAETFYNATDDLKSAKKLKNKNSGDSGSQCFCTKKDDLIG